MKHHCRVVCCLQKVGRTSAYIIVCSIGGACAFGLWHYSLLAGVPPRQHVVIACLFGGLIGALCSVFSSRLPHFPVACKWASIGALVAAIVFTAVAMQFPVWSPVRRLFGAYGLPIALVYGGIAGYVAYILLHARHE